MKKLLWQPSEKRKNEANITRFIHRVNEKCGLHIASYPQLYNWSVDKLSDFWGAMWDFLGIKASKKYDSVVEDISKFPGTKWFPGARLNFAENLLRYRDDQRAFIFQGETQTTASLTYAELYSKVARLAKSLRELGIKPGDRVAGYMPNMMETAIAMLASTSIGAVWSSCATDIGPQAVLDRLGQVEPVILFTVNGYYYKGKAFNSMDNVAEIVRGLSSLKKVVVAAYTEDLPPLSEIPSAVYFEEFLAKEHNLEIQFEQLPFNHPVYIMFSSGTTGKPKCMVQGAGGVLINHLKELILHTDLKREDTIFYITTCSWMMWNWLISSLGVGATILLYDGNPSFPDSGAMWRLIEKEKITYFGTSASYIDYLRSEKAMPGRDYDLSHLKGILQTGSALSPEGMAYVYRDIKEDLQRLSSGLQVNTAADGAAELAISEKMRAQIRGFQQARNNIQTSISLVQTAEAALNEVSSLLQRGRELSVQAASGTNTQSDRQYIQEEINQVQKEIDKISEHTHFNTIKLLQSSNSASDDTTPSDPATSEEKVIEYLQKGWLAAAENLVESTYNINGGGKDFTIELLDTIDGPDGRWAQVGSTYALVPPPYTGDNITLQIDMVVFASPSWPDGGDPPFYFDRIIAHEMAHAVMSASINIATGMETWFMEGTAESLHGADDRLSIDLSILGAGVQADGAQDLANIFDNPWSGASEYYSMAYAAVRYMDSLIRSAGGTGVNEITAYMAATTDQTLDQAIGANANLASNGIGSLADFTTKFKDAGAGGGVDYIKNTLIPALGNADTGSLIGSDVTGNPADEKTAENIVDETPYGTAITDPLLHFNEIWPNQPEDTTPAAPTGRSALNIQIGANSGQSLVINLIDSSTSALGISDVDVAEDAESAITRFNSAIKKVSTYRSGFGAVQNRLEAALNVAHVSEENITYSE